MLCCCCVRMIIYMRIHPSISTITETFMSVGRELLNFFFSFGLIFCFLAFIAHVRCDGAPAASGCQRSLFSASSRRPWRRHRSPIDALVAAAEPLA